MLVKGALLLCDNQNRTVLINISTVLPFCPHSTAAAARRRLHAPGPQIQLRKY